MEQGKRCLLLIDIQNDFCPGGALAVSNGDLVVPQANYLSGTGLFYRVVATQDWHPLAHGSFASSHGKKPGDIVELAGISQVLWPDHCVQGSSGAAFHQQLDLSAVNCIIRKGMNRAVDSYSAFFDNDHRTETGLAYYLKGQGITDIYVAGLALDYCVAYTAVDGNSLGFRVTVVEDATRGVDYPSGNVEKAKREMKNLGIVLADTDSVIRSLKEAHS